MFLMLALNEKMMSANRFSTDVSSILTRRTIITIQNSNVFLTRVSNNMHEVPFCFPLMNL